MCKILLSINPEHIDNIFSGAKQYEYRKTICKEKVDKIIIYSTSPVMKVVGEADVEEILVNTPDMIWKSTKAQSGITKKYFDNYYSNRNMAVAYKLKNVKKYSKPKDLKAFGVTAAPQSFIYIN